MENDLPSGKYLYKHVQNAPYAKIESAAGIYLTLENGQKILDATGGAAVVAIGHGNQRVKKAIAAQLDEVAYCHPGFFKTTAAEQLADLLIALQLLMDRWHEHVSRARVSNRKQSSEAVETAMKRARQYHFEQDRDTKRHHFIARAGSWHGCTLGALALGDFKVRKAIFEPILQENVSRVSACDPYHGLRQGESDEAYVARLAQELDDEFHRLGADNVCAFFVEPVVGTALGCVLPLPGYLAAVKSVCHRHGALFIFDKIMCGMGRTGTLHAWEQEGVAPDTQIICKSLGAGYAPISAILVNDKIIDGLRSGSGYFTHGHPYIGWIRGRGLFYAIEFVSDAISKAPFDRELDVAKRMANKGLEPGYDVTVFAATGAADGWNGDHFLLAPPFVVGEQDVREIVRRVGRVVDAVFEDLRLEGKLPAATTTGSCEGVDPTQVGVNGNAARGVDGHIPNGKATDLGQPAAGSEGGMLLNEVRSNEEA